MQVIRQTMSRAILLIVCLGYGIVRPKLLSSEWVAIGIVSLFYIVSAIVAQTADIIVVQNVHGDPSDDTIYKIPAMFMDIIFLSWIYLAITSTIRILTEFQQTVKLQMYKSLVRIIGVFVVIFSTVTVFVVLDDKKYIELPWQLSWLRDVLWESLNFMVLLAICVVCRPTANSHLLSYVAQLPTEEPDDDDFDDEELGDKYVKPSVLQGGRRRNDGDGDEDDGSLNDGFDPSGDGLQMSGRHGSSSSQGGSASSSANNSNSTTKGAKYNSGISLHKSTYRTITAGAPSAASGAIKSLPRSPHDRGSSSSNDDAHTEFSSLPAAADGEVDEDDSDLYDIAKD
jgi:hypothetical protein